MHTILYLKDYKDYGARGICVSKEFYDFKIWLDHVESLKDAYLDNYTIDRIDNNKNYEKGNLRWTSKSTQASNTRKLQSNNTSGYRGVSFDVKKWRTSIWVKNKKIQIGMFNDKLHAAQAYDLYVIKNKLPHTINGVLKWTKEKDNTVL